MPEWFSGSLDLPTIWPSLGTLSLRLLLAWVAGCFVAEMAQRHHPREATDTLPMTLILMSILIAMATQIIGDNVARAFSLVGALSIVRFRTAVPSSRDIAFVLASVVIGMAIGAGQWLVGGIGMVVVGIASELGQPFRSGTSARAARRSVNVSPLPVAATFKPQSSAHEAVLQLQVGLGAAEAAIPILTEIAIGYRLLSCATARRGSSLELRYGVQLRGEITPAAATLKLQAIPSIESIRWEIAD